MYGLMHLYLVYGPFFLYTFNTIVYLTFQHRQDFYRYNSPIMRNRPSKWCNYRATVGWH